MDVFDHVSALDGPVAPARRITGSATTFASAATPQHVTMMAVAVDTVRDILYVSSASQDSTVAEVAVFDGASTVHGNAAPSRVITTPATTGQMLNFNHGVLSDTANDRLYVASLQDSSVLVFDQASAATGVLTPTRWLSGPNTGLQGKAPIFMQLDSVGNLIVGCRSSGTPPTGGFISVFGATDIATSATGRIDVAPIRSTLSGPATTLLGPHMIAYHAESDELFVGNAWAGDVLVFAGFSSAAGDVAPTRALAGPATGLDIPATNLIPRTATGVFLDFTR